MASLEQLQTALINADKAGDTEAATALATELKRMRQPAAVSAGGALNDIPRQLGLTARYGLQAAGKGAEILTEPIRAVTDRLFGVTGQTKPAGALAAQFADTLGLPKPADANERVVGDATQLGFETMGMAGAARRVGGVASDALQFAGRNAPAAAQSATQKAAQFLGLNPGTQTVAAATGGLAGGASREAGGTPTEQAIASVVGTVGGGVGAQMATDLTRSGVQAVRSMIPRNQQMVQQRIDQRINITLQNQGIDPATITPAMRSAMREQVQQALSTGGDLNPEAVARLADYTRLGMTPTRARLTLDPFDVTQEQNVSRLAAASGSRDARLPAIAQDNNRRLIGLMDDMGGARPLDRPAQGAAVTGAFVAQDNALNNDVRSAYAAFRDSTGRDLPIPVDALRHGYRQTVRDFGEDVIPGPIRNRVEEAINPPRPPHAHGHGAPAAPQPPQTIVDTSGNVLLDLTPQPTPRTLSINDAEDLIKMINRRVNPADPAQTGALGSLRRAVQNSIIGATEDGNAMESATLANFARDAASRRFRWQESSPVIENAIRPGVNADTFVDSHILSKSAAFRDVATAAQTINQSPAARDAVRLSIVQKLKDAAIGKGGTSQTGNFSGRGLESAIKDIGDQKLALFFTPEEVQTLHAMARTGSFETFQPRGSAVNNSNSGAAIGSMLMGLTDKLRPLASRVPGAGPVVDWAILNPLENAGVWLSQRPSLNVPQSLLMPQPQAPLGSGLLLPGVAAGGLLASPSRP